MTIADKINHLSLILETGCEYCPIKEDKCDECMDIMDKATEGLRKILTEEKEKNE